ncbi:RHS repeat-associated core domain-containing protein, partial [Thiolapillus sp.]
LGRFLSPDTVIQFPNNSQSYNRYSYVLNNPLSYTDPSGHFIPVLMIAMQVAVNQFAVNFAVAAVQGMALTGIEATIVQTAIQAGIGGLAMGAASSAMGGTFADGFEAGVLSGIQSGIYSGVGEAKSLGGPSIGNLGAGITVKRVLAHGLVGGAFARARGDSFGSGFATGVFTKLSAGKLSESIPG